MGLVGVGAGVMGITGSGDELAGITIPTHLLGSIVASVGALIHALAPDGHDAA